MTESVKIFFKSISWQLDNTEKGWNSKTATLKIVVNTRFLDYIIGWWNDKNNLDAKLNI
jgi:hypothetical protein